MWYKLAQKYNLQNQDVKYNLLGQLVKARPKGKKQNIKFFAEEEDEDTIDVNQDPNIDDLGADISQPIDEEPIEEPFIEVPTLVEPEIETPVGIDNREPIPIVLPPGFKIPPVHEFCHCEIQTLPSGQQIWKLGNGENHCQECVQNMRIFNIINEQTYNR